MDKNKLYHKICEILILSQFEHWAEPKNISPTADWINSRPRRAIDYYLGKSNNLKENWEETLAMNRFHNIVNMQTTLIWQLIENMESLSEKVRRLLEEKVCKSLTSQEARLSKDEVECLVECEIDKLTTTLVKLIEN